jgi:MFS family permease
MLMVSSNYSPPTTTQVTQLWQFFLLRMLTGIAVGGCFPLVFSLLGDLFPPSRRAAMAAVVQVAVGAGIGGGQVRAAAAAAAHTQHMAGREGGCGA